MDLTEGPGFRRRSIRRSKSYGWQAEAMADKSSGSFAEASTEQMMLP